MPVYHPCAALPLHRSVPLPSLCHPAPLLACRAASPSVAPHSPIFPPPFHYHVAWNFTNNSMRADTPLVPSTSASCPSTSLPFAPSSLEGNTMEGLAGSQDQKVARVDQPRNYATSTINRGAHSLVKHTKKFSSLFSLSKVGLVVWELEWSGACLGILESSSEV